jgi:hypothetical protein
VSLFSFLHRRRDLEFQVSFLSRQLRDMAIQVRQAQTRAEDAERLAIKTLRRLTSVAVEMSKLSEQQVEFAKRISGAEDPGGLDVSNRTVN